MAYKKNIKPWARATSVNEVLGVVFNADDALQSIQESGYLNAERLSKEEINDIRIKIEYARLMLKQARTECQYISK